MSRVLFVGDAVVATGFSATPASRQHGVPSYGV